MTDDVYFKRVMTSVLLIVLVVLSFFLVKPILMSIIAGILLAFVFSPTYDWLNKKTKSRNLSASIISAFLALLIILPFWFFTPIFIEQSFKIYQAAQNFDFVTPLKTILPGLFKSWAHCHVIYRGLRISASPAPFWLTNAFGQLIL